MYDKEKLMFDCVTKNKKDTNFSISYIIIYTTVPLKDHVQPFCFVAFH